MVIASRHLKTFDLSRFVVGFLGKLVSLIRVLQRSFRMPDCRCEVPFFVVFSRSTMGLCRKIVLLGGFPVYFVRGVSSCGSVGNSPLICTRQTNVFRIGNTPEMAVDRRNLDERAIRRPIPGDKARIPLISSRVNSGWDSCMEL